MAGYSGTPLAKKLGIKEGASCVFLNEPKGFRKSLGKLPRGVAPSTELRKRLDYIHFFTQDRAELEVFFGKLKKALNKDGALWISWPKMSSGIKVGFNENDVREIGLAAGLVDVKVAAIDETWSGLKFVFRVKDR